MYIRIKAHILEVQKQQYALIEQSHATLHSANLVVLVMNPLHGIHTVNEMSVHILLFVIEIFTLKLLFMLLLSRVLPKSS